MWQAGNLMSCRFFLSQIFPPAHSSFPAGVRLGALTSGPGSGPARPSPRALASLQSQLCNGAPWPRRNPPEHEVSSSAHGSSDKCFEHFHQAFWLPYEVSMAPQSTFSNTDFGALRRELQEIVSVLREKKKATLILEMIKNAVLFENTLKCLMPRAGLPSWRPLAEGLLLTDSDGWGLSIALTPEPAIAVLLTSWKGRCRRSEHAPPKTMAVGAWNMPPKTCLFGIKSLERQQTQEL